MITLTWTLREERVACLTEQLSAVESVTFRILCRRGACVDMEAQVPGRFRRRVRAVLTSSLARKIGEAYAAGLVVVPPRCVPPSKLGQGWREL